MNAVGIIVTAGAISYLGSAKEAKSPVPANTVQIVFGTSMLAILASLVQDSGIREPVKWAAILMLIASAVRFVPKFSKEGK